MQPTSSDPESGEVPDGTRATPGPEQMRQAVRDYVFALHATYLDHVQHLPLGERSALPLIGAEHLTVLAAAARSLHLLAVGTAVAPVGPEAEVADSYRGLRWRLRFLDPTVVPELGLLADDGPAEVRRILGVSDPLYHLTVAAGGGLDRHHAQHSGVALANLHGRVGRDLDRLRHALPHQAGAVEELGVCVRIGLDRAAALLASDITGGRVAPEAGTPAQDCLAAVVADAARATVR